MAVTQCLLACTHGQDNLLTFSRVELSCCHIHMVGLCINSLGSWWWCWGVILAQRKLSSIFLKMLNSSEDWRVRVKVNFCSQLVCNHSTYYQNIKNLTLKRKYKCTKFLEQNLYQTSSDRTVGTVIIY